MSEMADAVIIGAGIVGAACAAALARDGLQVMIVESDTPGGGATAAGMGHIVAMDDSPAQFALTRYSRDLWNRAAPTLPPEVEFAPQETIWIAADEDEFAAVLEKHAYYSERGVPTQILDAAALASAEPQLRSGLAGALLVPGDSIIYAPCAARWLASQPGVSVRKGSVEEILGDGVRLADGTRLAAGVTVCATGTWAATLFPGIAVRPRKGHLAITDRYPGFVHHPLVELGYLKSAHGHSNESVAFNVQPRATGQVLIGSCRQYGQTHAAVDDAILRRMLQRAMEYMPGLAELSVIRTWTGFRAATEDKLPLVGPIPDRPNLYLATGHEGLGITTSLATGQMLADLIAGREPAIDITPYLPSRLPSEPAHA